MVGTYFEVRLGSPTIECEGCGAEYPASEGHPDVDCLYLKYDGSEPTDEAVPEDIPWKVN